MNSIDLRKCLNAISDVVNKRPPALRQFDQIYMKSADMLLQVEHVGKQFDGKRVVFIGDGDAIGTSLVYLKKLDLLKTGPSHVHVLDFDERMVSFVQEFAAASNQSDVLSSELYNVAEPLPESQRGAHEAFYTNPPFGQHNSGRSVNAFVRRGMEAVQAKGVGCVVIADDRTQPWTRQVLLSTQAFAISRGYFVSLMLPAFHTYHLLDAPELSSCNLYLEQVATAKDEGKPESQALTAAERESFYGENKHLKIRYVRRPATDVVDFGCRTEEYDPI